MTPDSAKASGFSGTPSARPSGSGRSWARVQSHACVVAGATKSSSRPSSRHRSTAHGMRPRKVSGPTSTATPSCSLVRTLPPARFDASSTTASTPACCRYHAVASPAMPPPTTTTLRLASGMTEDGVGDGVAQARVVVERLGAGESEPELVGPGCGLDVEVVEDLQVVGREPRRTHEHALVLVEGGDLVEDLTDVGLDPRLGRPPRALPPDPPPLDAGALGDRLRRPPKLL